MEEPRMLLDRLSGRLLGGFLLSDVLSARHHSVDFSHTRADYISRRLRFMLLFFVLAVPSWIPVDWLTLSPHHFGPVAQARLALAAFLALLLMAARQRSTPRFTHLLVFLTLAASCAFYLFAMITFSRGEPAEPLAGYAAMPVMMIALCALFPLTLRCGLALAAMITLSYVALQLRAGVLLERESLNTLWVICLMTGVSLWIQTGQLLMLLKLYRESTLDALTGLINRRVLMKQFDLLLADENQPPRFCVLMCDLDRFKRINDNHGHLTGDAVLKLAAGTLSRHLRRQDIIARYGGEEFMAILPHTSLEEAETVAENLRQAFEKIEFRADDGTPVPVTTSMGLTCHRPGERLEVLLERADQWLYLAKNRGRNRVVSDRNAQPQAQQASM